MATINSLPIDKAVSLTSQVEDLLPVLYTAQGTVDLDNNGEPCLHCSEPDAVVEAQVYYRSLATGERVMVDGCGPCMVKAIVADADTDYRVTIEVQR